MRILMIHKFLRPKGGAETYILRLGRYLEEQGHEVQYFGMAHPDNVVGNRVHSYTKTVDFHHISLWEKLRWGFRVVYSVEARQKLRRVLEDFQPEVCHLNNFNYQLTPSILLEICKWRDETGRSCRIVYTAHDYQLICPNHMCYDGRKNCEKCLDGNYISCVKEKCIHGSSLRSLLGAIESAFWHRTGIYRKLDTILCCSEFLKEKLDKDPVLREKTVLLRNFSDPMVMPKGAGEYVLYFGRYSREKGISLLVQAAKELPDIPFVFAGVGELAGVLEQIPNVTDAGFRSGVALKQLICGARFTVCPSLWYENCPFSVLESLDCGVPVLGARAGGIPELIQPGITGRLFPPNDLAALKEAVAYMWKEPVAHFDRKGAVTLPTYARQLLSYFQPEKTVTVVVPVYNTSAWLDRCVESIVKQTYQNLCILLIDDGSTDGSGIQCDRWAQRDARIQVIHQKNVGLGMTRNVGIAKAVGDAVCFVDSDDYLFPGTIERAVGMLQGKDAVVFGMCWENTSGKRTYRPISLVQYVYRDAQILDVFLPGLLQQKGNIPISSCAGMYDLEFLRRCRWRFPSEREIIAEDVYALLDLYGSARAVAVIPEALYVYCQRPDSLTHQYRPNRFESLKQFYGACVTLCKERNYPVQLENGCASVFLDITIGCMKLEVARKDWGGIRKILNDPLVQSALKASAEGCSMKKRILLNSLRYRRLRLSTFLLAAQNFLEGGLTF